MPTGCEPLNRSIRIQSPGTAYVKCLNMSGLKASLGFTTEADPENDVVTVRLTLEQDSLA